MQGWSSEPSAGMYPAFRMVSASLSQTMMRVVRAFRRREVPCNGFGPVRAAGEPSGPPRVVILIPTYILRRHSQAAPRPWPQIRGAG